MNQIFDTERVVVVVWVASAAAQGEQAAPENLAAPSMLLCMQEPSACCEARKTGCTPGGSVPQTASWQQQRR
eukprot:7817-Heterococcus_DN1.PRE.1